METPVLSPLDRNYEAFRRLLARSEVHLRRNRYRDAAACAQVAAQFAWMNHCGVFSSRELEEILLEIGRLLPPLQAPLHRKGASTRVLHVATQAYQTGGSTQYIASWIDQDADRRHEICLTRQLSVPVPDKLTARVSGRVTLARLDGRRGGLLGRAAALRRHAANADVVLIHTHPGDVLPVLALGGQPSAPPLVYVNQADHVFWVGVSIAHTLLNMRSSGAVLAAERRGVEPSRSIIAMRPLQFEGRTVSREVAKERLGLDPTAVLVLTAADETKYRPIAPPSLLDIVLPVFCDNPKAVLLAAGPRPEAEWLEAENRSAGRIRALGQVSDVTALHQAADVYLDSFPFSSLTSLLESASLGNPAVTYRGHPDDCAVLGADTAGVDQLLLKPRTPHDVREDLRLLIDDATGRRARGEELRRVIAESHSGRGWRAEADRVYAAAAASAPNVRAWSTVRHDGLFDELVRLVVSRSPHSRGVAGALKESLGLLPLGERASAITALRRHRAQVRATDVLSDRSRVALIRLRNSLLSSAPGS